LTKIHSVKSKWEFDNDRASATDSSRTVLSRQTCCRYYAAASKQRELLASYDDELVGEAALPVAVTTSCCLAPTRNITGKLQPPWWHEVSESHKRALQNAAGIPRLCGSPLCITC